MSHREHDHHGGVIFYQVLILLAASLLGRGEGGVSISEAVSKVVKEDARRERAVPIADRMEEEVLQFETGFADVRENLVAIVALHDSTAEEIEAVMLGGLSRAQNLEERLLDERFQLRAELSEEEWKVLWADFVPLR